MEATAREAVLNTTAGGMNSTAVQGELRPAPTHMSYEELKKMCHSMCGRPATVIVTKQSADGFPGHYPAYIFKTNDDNEDVCLRLTASLGLLANYNCAHFTGTVGKDDVINLASAEACEGITQIVPVHVHMHEFFKAEKAAFLDSVRQRDTNASAAASAASSSVDRVTIAQLQHELSSVRDELRQADMEVNRLRHHVQSMNSAASNNSGPSQMEQMLQDQLNSERQRHAQSQQHSNTEKQQLRDDIVSLQVKLTQAQSELGLARLSLNNAAGNNSNEIARLQAANAELNQLVSEFKARAASARSDPRNFALAGGASSGNNNNYNNNDGPMLSAFPPIGSTATFTNDTSTFQAFRNNFMDHDAATRIVDLASVRFQPQQRSSDSEAYRTLIWEAFRAWSQACEYFAPFIGPRDWASHPLVTTGTILLRYLKIAVAGKAKATLESLDYIGGQRAEALNDDDDDDFATAAAAAAHGKAKETQKKKKVEEKRRKQSPRSNGSSRSNSSSRRTKSPPGNGGAGQESNKWRGKH